MAAQKHSNDNYSNRDVSGLAVLPSEEYAKLKGRHDVAKVYLYREYVYKKISQCKCSTQVSHSCANCQELQNQNRLDHLGKPGDLKADGRFQAQSRADACKTPSTSKKHVNLHSSELGAATRQALGSSFYSSNHLDDDNEEYGGPRMASDWYDHGEDEEAIPKDYLQQFHQKWYEDDEDNDTDQLLADMIPHASWRNHAPIRPYYGPGVECCPPHTTANDMKDKTFDRMKAWDRMPKENVLGYLKNAHSLEPELVNSTFSWSSAPDSHARKQKKQASTKDRLKRCFDRAHPRS